MERFAVPGVGAILTQTREGVEYLLLQERCKGEAPAEQGMLEIPAGKIREFENLFDTLRREVKEETGLEVTEIYGEEEAPVYRAGGYQVLSFAPFACCQNLAGSYPIMVFTFVCRAEGRLLPGSDEAQNYRWVSTKELGRLLKESPGRFYPMHVTTLRRYLGLEPV